MKRLLSACALAAVTTAVLAVPASGADFDSTVHVVKDATPGAQKSGAYEGIALGARLIYSYESVANGNELWISDGSKAGTHLLKDIVSGPGSSSPVNLTLFLGKVYFQADDGVHGTELWVTDGTATGTKLYKDVLPGSGSSYASGNSMVVMGTNLYFAAYLPSGIDAGTQVWKTDGTPAHTGVVQVIRATNGTTAVSGLTRWGNRVAFSAKDDLGTEPWITDGTTAVMLKDINSGAGDSNPNEFTVVGTKLFFTAKPTGSSGATQVWHSDPPSGNFVWAFPLTPSVAISFPNNLVANGGTLFFIADSGTAGDELWKSDGTDGGTVLAQNINPSPGIGSSITDLTSFRGSLYFSARDGANNGELWKADSSNVTKVAEINPGPSEGSYPGDFVALGTQLYFSAKRADIGYELYATDGTGPGTKLVGDLAPGTYDSYADPMVSIGSTLFLTAQTPTLADELWVYTTRPSTTKGFPKSAYTRRAAANRKIFVPIKVRATGTTPIGKVYLKQGTKVVGVGVLNKYGNVSIRIIKAWRRGLHYVRAYYTGSVNARISHSTLIRIKVR